MLFQWFKWVGLFFLVSITAFFLAAYLCLHRGSRPWIKTSFPAISDWNSLRITLSRGPCLGTCPVYKVTIDGQGDVAFVGDVRSPAFLYPQVHRTYRIDEADVHLLFDAFRKAQFFWLYDDYGLAELDAPTCKIGIEFDGHRK